MASDFVSGKLSLSLEEFQEQFVKQRTLYWLRKVKAEKMKELLMNYRPTAAPRHNLPAATSSTAPYPTPSPLHSLPVHQQHPPHSSSSSSPGYPPDPSSSLPPYPAGQSAMPAPGPGRAGPFAYTPGFPKQSAPTRPAPYASSHNSFNQHRF